RQRRILHIDAIGRTGLVPALRYGRRRSCDDAPDRGKNAFEHVTPVRIQVKVEPAASGTLVVPAGPLACTLDAIKDPPAKFESKAGHSPKKAVRRKRAELLQAGQIDLVLDHPGF